MSCSCDSDGPDCFSSTERRARKRHRCCECWTVIEPGQRYRYLSGVWDGRGASFKKCLGCVALTRLVESVGCCTTFGGLLASASEVLRDPWNEETDEDAEPAELGTLAAMLWLARERWEAAPETLAS